MIQPNIASIKVAAVAGVLVAVLALGWTANGVLSARDAALAGQRQAVQDLADEKESRRLERKQATKVNEVAKNDRTVLAPRRRIDIDAVGAASDRLRAAAAPSDPAAIGPGIASRGQAADPADLVQARQLLQQCSSALADAGQKLGELAIYADAAAGAGAVCERAWDAMTDDSPVASNAEDQSS